MTDETTPENTARETGIPQVIHQGRYRLYANPDGGMRIQYRRDDAENDDHMELPGAILAMAKSFAEGKISPIEMFKRMRNLR